MDDRYIWGTISAGLLGLIGWVAKHITNSQKHPCKKDIVYKEVCAEKHKGFEDCVEREIKNLTKNFDDFKGDTHRHFKEVKDLIRQRNGG